MERGRKAYLYAAVTVLLWATVASAFKISLQHLMFLQLLLIASATSTIILFTILLFQKKLSLLKAFSRSDFFRSMGLGFLNPFLYYTVLFKAYSLLPAQEAQTLNFIWPITLVLLSIPLLKQKITAKNCLAIIVSFAGVFVISTRGAVLEFRLTDPLGVLLALGSSLVWALFWICNVKDRRDDTVKLFCSFLFGFVFASISIVLFSRAPLPAGIGIIGGIYVGLFEMSVTFLVWSKALRYAKTTAKVANLIYLVPVLSLIVISLAVGEKILFSTMIGLVFIMSGILLQQYFHTSRSAVKQSHL